MSELNIYSKEQTDALLGNKANTSTVYTKTEVDGLLDAKADATALAGKQDKLVSGMNIKTINNKTLLGSGNISITGQSNLVFSLASDSVTDVKDIIEYVNHRTGFIAIETKSTAIVTGCYKVICMSTGSSVFTPIAFEYDTPNTTKLAVIGGMIGGSQLTTGVNNIVVVDCDTHAISTVSISGEFRVYQAINDNSPI